MALNNLLDKSQKKMLSLLLISLGTVMILPPGIGPFGALDDLFINLPVAKIISQYSSISIFFALFLTYTIIPIILIWTGIKIFPAHSRHVENMKNKASFHFRDLTFKIRTDRNTQLKAVALLTILYIAFKWYSANISASINTLLGV